MAARRIPADPSRAAVTRLGPGKWKRAEGGHARFKALLETKPRAKARYDVVLDEIDV
jgi:hypothetical protein